MLATILTASAVTVIAPLPATISKLLFVNNAVPVLMETGPLPALVLIAPFTVAGLLPLVSVNPAGAVIAPRLVILLLAPPRFSADAAPDKVAVNVFAVNAADCVIDPVVVSETLPAPALRVLFTLVDHFGGTPIPIRELARRNDVPKRFLEQILLDCKTQGWVSSTAGIRGGYLLARNGNTKFFQGHNS